MTLAFIVRIEFDGARWRLTLLDVTSGERRDFTSLEGCLTALRQRVASLAALEPPPIAARSRPER